MAAKRFPTQLHQRGIRKICDVVGRAVYRAKELLSDPDKSGGYFCLLDIKTGAILITTIIGSVDPAKAERYRQLAEEKALRLYRYYQLGMLHVSGWQSRNEANDEWGGSVLGNRYIYSFSGFPPLYDEAISLATAFQTNDMPVQRAENIMYFSTSPRSRDMMDHPARAITMALAA